MPISEAQKRATLKYRKKALDRILLEVPRGQKDAIKAAADAAGESMNGYIKKAINQRMNGQQAAITQDGSGHIITISPDAAAKLQELAQLVDCPPAFIIENAIEIKLKQAKITKRAGEDPRKMYQPPKDPPKKADPKPKDDFFSDIFNDDPDEIPF